MPKPAPEGDHSRKAKRPTVLLVVRHTDVHNPREVIYGRLPRFRLSELGRRQAERTAEYLAQERIAAIYSSPLLRARQTARAIAVHHPHAELHIARLITETGTKWQGTPDSEFPAGLSFYDVATESTDETPKDIAARMLQFVRRVLRQHAGQTVVAVSHGDPIGILGSSLMGEPLTEENFRGRYYPARGAIFRFEFEDAGEAPVMTYVDPSKSEEALAPTPPSRST